MVGTCAAALRALWTGAFQAARFLRQGLPAGALLCRVGYAPRREPS